MPTPLAADRALAMETIEALAFTGLLHAAPAGWRCVAEASAGGWLLHVPPLDVLVFNRILAIGTGARLDPDGLRELVERLRASGLRNYGVQVAPALASALPATTLAAAGLVARDRWTKFWRPADPPAPSSSEVRIAAVAVEDADVFGEVASLAHGMPPMVRPWLASLVGRPGWRHYLAWNSTEPIGAGSLFVHADVGWLGVGGTLPAHRRHGAQAMLISRRIEDGLGLGCRWFVSETGEDTPERPNSSSRNLLRAGFHIAYQRQNFGPPKES